MKPHLSRIWAIRGQGLNHENHEFFVPRKLPAIRYNKYCDLSYLSIDQSSKREVVEQVSEVFPNIRIAVFPQTLIVKAVHLSDLSAFVVTTQQSDSVRVPNLHREQSDSVRVPNLHREQSDSVRVPNLHRE